MHHASFTSANVHDLQELDDLLIGKEGAIFADKVCDSVTRKRSCREKGVFYDIQEGGCCNRSLSNCQKAMDKHKSVIRILVERVFAHLKHWHGYCRVRYLTSGWNKFQFLFLCMVYNGCLNGSSVPIRGRRSKNDQLRDLICK
ncbi:MAG: transposase [Promethearchaeota archaeon]